MAFIACVLGLTSSQTHADLYSADAAYRAKDFRRAFELFRELAELGHAESQETLAIMYVQGEGVERNNTLGHAWAVLVLEQASSEAAQSIVDQLGPKLTESMRKSVEELRAKFGKDALRKTILRTERVPYKTKKFLCTMKAPVNPDNFFPPDAAEKGISGDSIIDARVFSDGRDHDPRAARQIPAQPLNGPAMLVSMNNTYGPQFEDGIAQPCTMRFKVKFSLQPARRPDPAEQNLGPLRKKAEDGDPSSQLLYGLMLQKAERPQTGEAPLEWFVKAAQAGIPVAQYLVGRDQLDSFGFQPNVSQGIFWLEKAARGGDSEAQLDLASYYTRETPGTENARKAVELLGLAVDAGRPEARFYLAALLASHPDAEVRNPKRALEIFGKDRGVYELNPIAWEIRAAAHANLGEFEDAGKLEKRAIRMAKTFHWHTAPLEARLAAYEAKKNWFGDLLAFY